LDAAHRPHVVFCTSRSETQDIFKGIEAGADEYVTKPFTAASLRAKLERIGAV
jgi:two-component system, chemotaxis family, chemotaxis protein CheY